jgi:hypothetical protein
MEAGMNTKRRVNFAISVIVFIALVLGYSPQKITAQTTENPIVYVVIAIDTENGNICWYPTQECRSDPHPIFDTVNYKPTTGQEFPTIFDPEFRAAHVDSFGTPFKMSWFLEMDQQFEAATYLNEGPAHPELTSQPAGYTAILDTINRYWGSQIAQYGDGLYWHHHVQDYTNGAWNMDENVISGYTRHYDSLSSMVVDRAYFPSTYRAGWLWEDSNMNTFLNNWVPFDFSASSGLWVPFHPNVNDPYSSGPPNINRWMTRTDGGVSQDSVNSAFQYAIAHGSAIYSFYFHDREDMTGNIDNVQTALNVAKAAYPTVSFKYTNGQDAYQSFLNFSDRTPPTLSLTHTGATTFQLTSNEPIWQPLPYMAAKYVGPTGHRYANVAPTLIGMDTWQATFAPQITISPPPPTPLQYHPSAVTASSQHLDGNGLATNAVDGNETTMWDSAIDLPGGGHGPSLPAWINLEFNNIETVNKLEIHFYDGDSRSYTFGVESSTDGSSYSWIVPAGTVIHGLATYNFDTPIDLKDLRITVTNNSNGSSYAHIYEIRLYGDSSLVQIPASSASATSFNPNPPGYPPSNAIDSNDTTYWDSGYVGTDGLYHGQVPASLTVNLGAVRNIQQFSIHLYDNDDRSYTYDVESSVDGQIWTQRVTSGQRKGNVLHDLLGLTAMQYLRINVTGGTVVNANGTFAHIKEVRLYGEGVPPQPEVFYLQAVGAGATDLSGNPAAVRAEVVNDPPTVVNDTASTSQDTPVVINVLNNDSDGDGHLVPSSLAVRSGPSHGTTSVNSVSGEITYSPAVGFFGSDSFTYEICDDGSPLPAECSTGTVSIYITPNNLPPPFPASFYGEIHIQDTPPTAGQLVEAFIEGISGPAVVATISGSDPLVYSFNIPGDIANTPAKEGGAEGDPITFKINDRLVATSVWHSGTNTLLNIHPPRAVPGGPYEGIYGDSISFSTTPYDWGTDVSTYDWDWGDGTAHSGNQNPSHTFPGIGHFTVRLTVTDAQGGLGTDTVGVTVNARALDITANNQSKTYGDVSTFTGSEFSTGAGQLVNGDTVTSVTMTSAGAAATATVAGSPYAIVASDAVGTGLGNYTINYHNGSFAVTTKALTITANDRSKVAGTELTFSGTEFTPIGLVNGDTVTSVTLTSTGAPASALAGTYPIVASNASGTGLGNYTIGYVDGTLLVENTSHSLTLVPGWNLVSFNIHPVNTSPAAVLASIDTHYDLVYAWDGNSQSWLSYDTILQTSDSLTVMDEKIGFWIHVTGTEPVNLNVTGSIPTDHSINMYNTAPGGWNLVGLPAVQNQALPDAFDSSLGVSLAYAYHANDLTDPWKLYDAVAPSWSYDLKELSTGWGYWVKVTNSGTWTVNYP